MSMQSHGLGASDDNCSNISFDEETGIMSKILTILNIDKKSFKADEKNINDGYPILSWQ